MSADTDHRFGTGAQRPTPVVTHLGVALGIGLLVAFFMYFVRAPVPRVAGAAAVIALASFVLLRAMEVARVSWPAPAQGRAGAFDRVQRWRLNGFDAATAGVPGFSPHLQVRLSALATAILSVEGLAPGSPAAVALLGSRTHDLLYPPDREPGQARPADPAGDELLVLIETLIELSAAQHAPNKKGDR